MAIGTLKVDSGASLTLATTSCIPVINSAVTGTGDILTVQTTLADLATFFATVDGPFIMTAATATPSAFTSTKFEGFSSTTLGAAVMGFGTTYDVTLVNRAGTTVLGIGPNTTAVTMAGALAIGGALSGVTTLGLSGAITGATATNTINGVIINSGAVSGVTTLTATGTIAAGAAEYLSFTGRSAISSSANGHLKLSNAAGTGFSDLYYGAQAGATTSHRLQKAIASITDNTDTNVFTVSVPNAAHSAMIRVTLCGSLGAGGAIGANEASQSISYDIAVARTAGVATVATASSAYGSANSAVAGAATITVTGAVSAISGAVGDPQTFTITVKIVKGGGASDNHTCVAIAEILNANATGVSIA